jgi:FAD synthase
LAISGLFGVVAERAAAIGAVPTVVTFDPHPRSIVRPETAPPLLQTFAQKMEGLRLLGVHQVLVLDFTPELAAISAEDFVERFLVRALDSREVYLGEGFAFGHQRRGTIELLRDLSHQLGFLAEEIPEVQLRGYRISSTLIRQLLQAGEVNTRPADAWPAIWRRGHRDPRSGARLAAALPDCQSGGRQPRHPGRWCLCDTLAWSKEPGTAA